jgi:hypothetical protein
MPRVAHRKTGIVLAAGLGYVVAFAATLVAWHFIDSARSAAAMQDFGEATAEEVAQAAVEPLLREDRIRLGLLANRLVARAEVQGIAIYTVGDEPFVVVGNLPSEATIYVARAAIQGAVAGYVRVAVDAERFGLSAWGLLAEMWLYHAAGLLLTLGTVVAVRWAIARPRPAADRGGAPQTTLGRAPESVYVLVANLFRRATQADRSAALEAGLAVAQRVANLYAGHAAPLRGAGFLLSLPARTSADRGFEVICAALLVRELCAGVGDAEDGDAAVPRAFRYSLDLVEDALPDDAPGRAAAIRPLAVLASLAPDGELVLGEAAYATVERPERLRMAPFENPALGALQATVAAPRGIALGTTEEHEALLARQAELIAATGA